MVTIENEMLKIAVNEQGAELNSIYHKTIHLEYMWSGNPAFWAKRSPVLFPIVGSLKDNRYYYKEQVYEMGRHGFARESLFTVQQHSGNEISFLLESNTQTLQHFPFDFQFLIFYRLLQNNLSVSYQVRNESKESMYFSVGGHPAFKLPLAGSTIYEDYFLEFNAVENAGRWPISKDGLIENKEVPLLINTNRLLLTKDLFMQDALVFKHLSSNTVSLKSHTTVHGLDFDFTGFPYLGIWAAKNADFVCIEPWCGIADGVYTSQQLTEKEGINKLDAGMIFNKTWTVTLY